MKLLLQLVLRFFLFALEGLVCGLRFLTSSSSLSDDSLLLCCSRTPVVMSYGSASCHWSHFSSSSTSHDVTMPLAEPRLISTNNNDLLSGDHISSPACNTVSSQFVVTKALHWPPPFRPNRWHLPLVKEFLLLQCIRIQISDIIRTPQFHQLYRRSYSSF